VPIAHRRRQPNLTIAASLVAHARLDVKIGHRCRSATTGRVPSTIGSARWQATKERRRRNRHGADLRGMRTGRPRPFGQGLAVGKSTAPVYGSTNDTRLEVQLSRQCRRSAVRRILHVATRWIGNSDRASFPRLTDETPPMR
jgi:hypothetical protein